ncbi:MAG TPA: hypothetical protein VMW27_07310 [Thermoanaerobaculia bacterium]|nr:hypothetical protein [Thermoanaerobaculia bacterium]
MPDQTRRALHLLSLSEGRPGLTPAWGTVMAEAASVCFEDQGHGESPLLSVDGDFIEVFTVHRPSVDEQMRRSHADVDRATENGACGVSILAVQALTHLTVLHQAWRGMGFDYWLGPEYGFLFQGAARLEVSGIRKGDETSIRNRVRQKLAQTERTHGVAPVYVAVVEFSRPALRIVQR